MPIAPSAALRARYEQNGNGGAGRLAVLGSGPIPPDPGEFVASAALTEVLKELEEIADVVLVDAPPLLHVGDAMVLSAKVDAAILVTKLQTVRRPMLAEMHRLLQTLPTMKLGFVVTGAEGEEGYGYGYGYGYQYAPRPYGPREEERIA
jgi:receptor protein-tyrosine kinase